MPQRFEEWIATQSFTITRENAEKLVDAYITYRDRRYAPIICDICGLELTREELRALLPEHFNITCNAHKEYREKFQVGDAKERYGYYTRVKQFFQ